MKSIASLVATIIHNPVSGSYEFSSDFDHRYDIRKNPNVYIELYRTIYVIIDIIEPIGISERCLLYSSIIHYNCSL